MKKLLFICILSFSVLLCACSETGEMSDFDDSSLPQIYETSDGKLIYGGDKNETDHGSPVKRGGEKQVSSPEESIEFDEAVRMIDSCGFEELYLPQKVKDYKKYYFDTVTYEGSQYYSIDFYIESKGKRAFVGTNCIVACDGSEILAKSWTSDYTPVKLNSSSFDISIKELYKDAKITPNEALAVLISFDEKKLGLEYDLSSYTFEIDTEIYDIKGIKCYRIYPKINYENSVVMRSPYYVTVDGSNRVIVNDAENIGDYKEIKQ